MPSPKEAALADQISPKLDRGSYSRNSLSTEEAMKAPGGLDFIAEKNAIDSTYSMPINGKTQATWGKDSD